MQNAQWNYNSYYCVLAFCVHIISTWAGSQWSLSSRHDGEIYCIIIRLIMGEMRCFSHTELTPRCRYTVIAQDVHRNTLGIHSTRALTSPRHQQLDIWVEKSFFSSRKLAVFFLSQIKCVRSFIHSVANANIRYIYECESLLNASLLWKLAKFAYYSAFTRQSGDGAAREDRAPVECINTW